MRRPKDGGHCKPEKTSWEKSVRTIFISISLNFLSYLIFSSPKVITKNKRWVCRRCADIWTVLTKSFFDDDARIFMVFWWRFEQTKRCRFNSFGTMMPYGAIVLRVSRANSSFFEKKQTFSLKESIRLELQHSHENLFERLCEFSTKSSKKTHVPAINGWKLCGMPCV